MMVRNNQSDVTICHLSGEKNKKVFGHESDQNKFLCLVE